MRRASLQLGLVAVACVLVLTIYLSRGRTAPHLVTGVPAGAANEDAKGPTKALEIQPTRETVAEILNQLQSKVESGAASALPDQLKAKGQVDLARAASAWVGAMIDPDFAAFHKFRVDRGFVHPAESESEKTLFLECVRDTRFARMSLARADVRMIYVNGRRVAPPDRQGDESALETAIDGAYPIPSDLKASLATICEIRLPMERRSSDGREVPVVVGYRFYWHPQRNQWIPHSTVQYHRKSDGIAITPI